MRRPILPRVATLPLLFLLACTPKEGPTGPDGGAAVGGDQGEAKSGRFTYPESAKGDVVDDYHGVKVADPYRWLEDPDSPETRAWVEAENKVTFGYLESLPARAAITKRLTELWNYERYGVPYREGGRYFWSRNDGLQNQNVIYTAKSPSAEPKVVIDPNTLSADGTVALSGMAVSPNGKLLAYGIAASGSDWQEYRVREIDSGKDREDLLKWIKFSGVSWTKDNKGFFYSRYDEPKEGEALKGTNLNQKLYYHRLGAPQAEDVLIYERPDHPKWGYNATVSDDGKYLIVEVWEGSAEKNAVLVKELKGAAGTQAGGVTELLINFDAKYDFIDNNGSTFWFRTDLEAPRGKVIAIDLKKPAREEWKVLIPESAETLRSVSAVGDRFFANYLKDAHSQVKIFDLKGALERDLELPGLGTVYGFGGKRKDKETFYMFTGYTVPGSIYHYDVKKGTSELFREPKVAFDPNDYVTEQIFYPSKDGTKIPLFITHKKGLAKDGNNPTLLYGYGGFNIPLTPSFSVANLQWMEMGGVLAVANLRGGGEYGESWHQAGTKLNKQNVFDDFIAAAEWLIANKYTQPAKLAINGRSNGGLLVGAAMTQRPDLFKVALPGVGVLDMLRFHKFTIGWAWVPDYGSSEDPAEFKALYKYSPLHNLKAGTEYPATLIHTADHDDRVVPGHSFKFAAALQDAHKGDNPVMIRIETKAGHGAGKPTSKKIEEAADLWAFAAANLGMEFSAPGEAAAPVAAEAEASASEAPASEAAPAVGK
ncbi:MAG: S9 family peptidase [Myxococcales bacterium]|nr:S9 family peptidase [Myxococcales bacterium]MCB9705717.1 S9 family peptidase [Myxococcales bacterium]